MSTRSLAFLLILTIISTSSSFHVSSKTNLRTITRSTSMSLKTMGYLRKAFATVALTVVFTADLGDSKQLFSLTPPAAHARGMNESRWRQLKCSYYLRDAAWDDCYAFTSDDDIPLFRTRKLFYFFFVAECAAPPTYSNSVYPFMLLCCDVLFCSQSRKYLITTLTYISSDSCPQL